MRTYFPPLNVQIAPGMLLMKTDPLHVARGGQFWQVIAGFVESSRYWSDEHC